MFKDKIVETERNGENEIHNIQAIIDSLSLDILFEDLSHITGESIHKCAEKNASTFDLENLSYLLEILVKIQECSPPTNPHQQQQHHSDEKEIEVPPKTTSNEFHIHKEEEREEDGEDDDLNVKFLNLKIDQMENRINRLINESQLEIEEKIKNSSSSASMPSSSTKLINENEAKMPSSPSSTTSSSSSSSSSYMIKKSKALDLRPFDDSLDLLHLNNKHQIKSSSSCRSKMSLNELIARSTNEENENVREYFEQMCNEELNDVNAFFARKLNEKKSDFNLRHEQKSVMKPNLKYATTKKSKRGFLSARNLVLKKQSTSSAKSSSTKYISTAQCPIETYVEEKLKTNFDDDQTLDVNESNQLLLGELSRLFPYANVSKETQLFVHEIHAKHEIFERIERRSGSQVH